MNLLRLARLVWSLAVLGVVVFTPAICAQQATGTLQGIVRLKGPGTPLPRATVTLLRTGRVTQTDQDGAYVFEGLPPGEYEVTAHLHQFADERKSVRVEAGKPVAVDFELSLDVIRQELTVTASLQEETTLETFSAVTSRESFELAARAASPALGDLLKTEPGIAERSGGPGTGRPVIRGFDGDRVLVMQDGIPTGTLSSTSSDHAEPLEVGLMERVEVVRGPATLLYGSNAVGGVVNIISAHHFIHHHPHEGVRGQLSATAGSANAQAGTSGNLEIGKGEWLIWLGGSGMRTGDYSSPAGLVPNSGTDLHQSHGGIGYYGNRSGADLNYSYSEGGNGVPRAPHAEEVDDPAGGDHQHGDTSIVYRRHAIRANLFFHDVGRGLEHIHFSLGYTDWNHTELTGGLVETDFFNRQLTYRGEFTQKQQGRWNGKFGVWGLHRDFKALGEESLAPHVRQNAFAAFALEEVQFERFRLQFGARLENNRYGLPAGTGPDRSFTGASASAGIHVPLWKGGAFVASYAHSFRAPSLEELYNYGPHHGNFSFEIGNSSLRAERSNGLDFALRHSGKRLRAEWTFFENRSSNFIYLEPTKEVRDGLPVGLYRQGGARFVGSEARAELATYQDLWFKLGLDYVDAELTEDGRSLPRIPPLRAKLGLDWRWKNLSVSPETVLARSQNALAPLETRTAGYAIFDLNASYIVARAKHLHQFSVAAFNLSNRLYRNHLSFIKEFAPEMGRGIRFSYTIRFF